MILIFPATIFLSAFLLFLVQPIIAKQILPWFGGSAAVWTTCMVFFQCALLAGYAYSDWLTRRPRLLRQVIVHGVLLAAALVLLASVGFSISPPAALRPSDPSNPIGRILTLLAVTIGLPYLVLATTGPLLQAWFARAYPQRAVWRLYALSNIGSMLALIAYPLLVEPAMTGAAQSRAWGLMFCAYVVLAGLAACVAWVALPDASRPATGAPPGDREALDRPDPDIPDTAPVGPAANPAAPTLSRQAIWLLLSATGSVLLLTVTTHVTQNVATIPFLWVLPLAIYLLSFILCFDSAGWYKPRAYRALGMVAAILMLGGLTYRFGGKWIFEPGLMPLKYAVPLYSIGLFVLCMLCNGELVARRPATAGLTRFYLVVSAGGALGGLAVGIVAPLVLSNYWEFPAVLCVAALIVLAVSRGKGRMLAAAGALAGAALTWVYVDDLLDTTVIMTRNFYGVLRVRATAPDSDENATWRLLHGVILHGEQYRDEQSRDMLTTYYGESSGFGRAIAILRGTDVTRPLPLRIGVIGMGVGTLAGWGEPGDDIHFYEIDAQVLSLAHSHFSYLADSDASIETTLGDARLSLESQQPQRFDLLAVDAFSSDSIPAHLLTINAMAVYARHLSAQGAVLFHVSNRYLDLLPITRQLADSATMRAIRIVDDPPRESVLYRSDWVVVTANQSLADTLMEKKYGQEIAPRTDLKPWTDDYSNLFQILK